MKQICHRLNRDGKVRILTSGGSSCDGFRVKTKERWCLSPRSSGTTRRPVALLRTGSLKAATAVCSPTGRKGFPKLFARSGSSRTVGFTATRHHQHPNNPLSVLPTDPNKNALFTSYLSQIGEPLETKTQAGSLLPCIAERDGPARDAAAA